MMLITPQKVRFMENLITKVCSAQKARKVKEEGMKKKGKKRKFGKRYGERKRKERKEE